MVNIRLLTVGVMMVIRKLGQNPLMTKTNSGSRYKVVYFGSLRWFQPNCTLRLMPEIQVDNIVILRIYLGGTLCDKISRG